MTDQGTEVVGFRELTEKELARVMGYYNRIDTDYRTAVVLTTDPDLFIEALLRFFAAVLAAVPPTDRVLILTRVTALTELALAMKEQKENPT